jgi:hypothetical protein
MKLGAYSERLDGRRVSDCAPRRASDVIKPAPQISPGAVNSGDVR